MVRRARSGLRVRLIVLVLLATLPIVGLVIYDAVVARNSEVESVSQQVGQLAQLASASVAQVIEGKRQLLIAMSRLPVVINRDTANCSAVMVDLLAQYGHYSNLGAITPTGEIFCTAIPQSLPTNVADRTYYLRALEHGDFVLGDYQIGRLSGIAVVVAAYPVYAGNELLAVVFAALDLAELNTIIATVALPPGAALTVIDHNSTILARNPEPEAWVGQVLPDAPVIQAAVAGTTKAQQLTGVDGVLRLYAFSDVPNAGDAGLRVAVGMPTEVAFAGVLAALRRNLITLGVVTGLALAAAWVGAGAFVLRPLNKLVRATRALAEGDLTARVGGPYDGGEVGQLAEAFDGMAEGLDQRSRQLTRLNRMLKMRSECNRALVRATTEPQLLGAVCGNIVSYGGYPLVWVRLAGAEADPPAALAGGDAAAVATLEQAATAQHPDAAHTEAALVWPDLALPGYAALLTLAAIPLAMRGEFLGRLALATAHPAGFSLDEMQLLEELAGDLAFGLAALRGHAARQAAEAQVHTSAERALAIANIGRDLAAVTTDYQTCMDTLVQRLAELVGDGALISFLSDDGALLTPQASHHSNPAQLLLTRQVLASRPSRTDSGVAAQVLAAGQTVVLQMASPEQLRALVSPEFWDAMDRHPLHTLLVAPLRAQGRIFGTLAAWRDVNPATYAPDDVEFVTNLADQAALAITNARLYAAAQESNVALEQRVAVRTRELAASNQALEIENADRRTAEAIVQRSAAEIQDLYDNAPCGYHSLDPAGVYVRINEYELKLLGYTRAEVVGKLPFREVLTPASREIFRESYPAFIERGWVDNLEFEMLSRDGRVLTVLLSATALRDAAGAYVMSRAMVLDITGRKRAEQQVDGLNTTLRQRAAALEAANRELEAFSYSVSHDLRAPLRSIDGFSLALLEDYGSRLDPEARDYLQRVRGAAQRMAALIDDLLNLSRVSRADMRWETVDLSALAQSIAEELQQAQPDRAVTVTIEPGLTAAGDGRLLRLALENMLNNAWKFTSKRAAAEIAFGAGEFAGRRAFYVRDNGAGFDRAYAQRLFGAFQRLHDHQEFPGTGIGLATVQRVINRHGGQVWAEGQVGQGATFYFTLTDELPPAA